MLVKSAGQFHRERKRRERQKALDLADEDDEPVFRIESTGQMHKLFDVLIDDDNEDMANVVTAFEEHLVHEHNQESLDFLRAVDAFVAAYDGLTAAENREKALSIYTRFVSTEAHDQINISSELSRKTKEACVPASSEAIVAKDAFEDASNEIKKLIIQDTFARFLKTKHFRSLSKDLTEIS